jgi:hypothetical protein
MYLFSRRLQLNGTRLREAIGLAVEITQKVNQITGQQVLLMTPVFSPGTNSLVYGMRVPDLATLEAAGDKLQVDDGFNDLVEKIVPLTIPGSLNDQLRSIISGPTEPDPSAEYYAIVRTSIAAGKFADGMALGVEIAQRAGAITGVQTTFAADATGQYGGVAWLTAYPNIGALERAQTALNADKSFIEFLDKKTKGVYAEAEPAPQSVLRRIPT